VVCLKPSGRLRWETRPRRALAHSPPANSRPGPRCFLDVPLGNLLAAFAKSPSLQHGCYRGEKYTIAVDPGIVVNPMQLKRQVEGGAVMGIAKRYSE